ncbi:MAG: hypothetical protein R3293_06265, partial [Candidatus Promineifilaceae bacterium]|nr:hypothetical protein [Candidatus Promineifilaceae bacterium]
MASANSGRRQELEGFDEDYVDIVDYIVRCTHKIWEEGTIVTKLSMMTGNIVPVDGGRPLL